MSSMSWSCTAGSVFFALGAERSRGSCLPLSVGATRLVPTPRARIAADIANSTREAPASATPSQTTGLKTRRTAQLTIESPICQISWSVPVSPAAAGSSDQAVPRIPEAAPRARHSSRLMNSPTTLSVMPIARQVVASMSFTPPAYGARRQGGSESLRGLVDDGRVRDLPDPGFTGDDGSADPELSAALAAYAERPGELHDATLAVLQHARLLVPVVAVLGEVEHDEHGLAHDKTSDMATVLMQGRDGRTALLAFTSTRSLQTWRADARPVPVTVATAAAAAVQDGADAVLVDVAGPVLFAVEGEDLRELASGHVLVTVSGRYGWGTPGR